MDQLPYVANTDRQWFDYLSTIATRTGSPTRIGTVDEANFWFPNAQSPHITSIVPGTPVFLRLKRPEYSIAGVGFFASYRMLALDDAWLAFGRTNGDPDYDRFYRRILTYRIGRRTVEVGTEDANRAMRSPLACMVLRGVELWPRQTWIPWGPSEGFASQIVTGKFESNPERSARLLAAIQTVGEIRAAEFSERFNLVDADGRTWRQRSAQAVREGQSTFRLRLLDAYDGQCAITGEHTIPVLDAAHIQPYLGAASNHVQNGLLLTKEFHTLFDRGYITVTDDYRVRVSPELKSEFGNGRRYYPYDGKPLAKLPSAPALLPSPKALKWHGEFVFRAS
jgi:putative restriction endonuclease